MIFALVTQSPAVQRYALARVSHRDSVEASHDHLVKNVEIGGKAAHSLVMASQLDLSPRAARTRSALVAAGFELLVDRPIDAIPIDDIVAQAGVAKGSFFNHFKDKQAFADAIGTEVRLELDDHVSRANAGVSDPVERIAGGMCVGAEFALRDPKRFGVLLRSHGASTVQTHPLNRGLREDFEAACAQGLLRSEARESGVLYWLGLCQILLSHLIEIKPKPAQAAQSLSSMLILGLTGLGVPAQTAAHIAERRSSSHFTVAH